MADIVPCIFCSELISRTDQATILKQKGLDGILKANEKSKIKIFPSVGDKVKRLQVASNPGDVVFIQFFNLRANSFMNGAVKSFSMKQKLLKCQQRQGQQLTRSRKIFS